MKLSTAIKMEQILKNRVYSIFKRAAEECWSSKKLNKVYNEEVLKMELYIKVPRHVISFVNGYHNALHDAHWDKVVWVFPYKGKIYNNFQDLPPKGRLLYMKKDVYGIHAYKKNLNKHFTGDSSAYLMGVENEGI